MQRDRHARRQQLRPYRQVQLALEPDVDAEDEPDEAPDHQAGGELAAPRDRRGPEGEVEVVGLVGAVEGEVGVDVLVGAEVEDDDAAEEGHDGRVLGQEADEDVARLELLVGAVAERGQAHGAQGAVEGRRHHDGRGDDERGRREDLEDDELGW